MTDQSSSIVALSYRSGYSKILNKSYTVKKAMNEKITIFLCVEYEYKHVCAHVISPPRRRKWEKGNCRKVIGLTLPCHQVVGEIIVDFHLWFFQFFINISSGDYPGPLCWHYFMKQIKKWEGKNISLVFSVPGHQRVGEIMVNFHLQALPTFSQQFLLIIFSIHHSISTFGIKSQIDILIP